MGGGLLESYNGSPEVGNRQIMLKYVKPEHVIPYWTSRYCKVPVPSYVKFMINFLQMLFFITVVRIRIRYPVGIRCLFDPWIWDPGWVKNQDYISESLKTIFGVKNTWILWCGSGSGIRNLFDPGLDPGWKNSDPGSGINIPDPQHFSTPAFIVFLLFFYFFPFIFTRAPFKKHSWFFGEFS